MKKYSVLFLSLFIVFSVKAQNIPLVKSAENTNEEIIELLRLLGAHSYRFDLSGLSDKEYKFGYFVEEYSMGEKVEENGRVSYVGSNWRQRFSDPDFWNDFVEKNHPRMSADGQKFLSLENMGLYVVPKNDSVAMVEVSFYGVGTSSIPLNLKTLENSQRGPLYDYRLFKTYPVTSKEQRIPLLLCTSFWWDEKHGIFRSCMERELEPDLSSESLRLSPHYYVIGIIVKESE